MVQRLYPMTQTQWLSMICGDTVIFTLYYKVQDVSHPMATNLSIDRQSVGLKHMTNHELSKHLPLLPFSVFPT
jgi:hypothetical protein